jgi:outer membrane protein OmpA-like peptidoglycan-associated protein
MFFMRYLRTVSLFSSVFLGLTLLLSGCQGSLSGSTSSVRPGIFTQWFNETSNAFDTKVASHDARIVSELHRKGVQVIQVGDTVSLLYPVDRFFDPDDDILADKPYRSLDLAVELLNEYPRAAVKIAVSADDVETDERAKVLTARQAERIAAYLWRGGVNAWRLYPVMRQ